MITEPANAYLVRTVSPAAFCASVSTAPATCVSNAVTAPKILTVSVVDVSDSTSNFVTLNVRSSSPATTLEMIVSGEAPPNGTTISVLASAPTFVNVSVCSTSSTTGLINAPTTGTSLVV